MNENDRETETARLREENRKMAAAIEDALDQLWQGKLPNTARLFASLPKERDE